jgi:hypothetical protein
MNLKLICVFGLALLLLSRILMSNGTSFINAQHPIDFAHWAMLTGALLMTPFHRFFPKGIFNTIATPMTMLGIAAHIGMCTIDFVLWSYGDAPESRDALIHHLANTPVIWMPFITIGPSLLYAGLATQAWPFVLSHPLAVVLTMLGSVLFVLGHVVFHNEIISIIGFVIFATGLIRLLYRKNE